MLNNLNPKYRQFFLPTTIFLFIILSGSLFLFPKIAEINSLRQSLDNDKAYLAQLTTKAALLESLDKSEIDSKLKLMTDVIPEQKNPLIAFSSLKSLSAQEQLTEVNISVSPGLISTDSGTVNDLSKKSSSNGLNENEMQFKFQASGNKNAIIETLKKLESVAPYMQSTGVIFDKSQEEAKLDLAISSYFEPMPIEISKIDTPISTLTTQDEAAFSLAGKFQKLEIPLLAPLATGKDNLFSF